MDIKRDDDLVGHALADPALLSKIDKLFACNVGEYVSLPQLVVVGDQSSGKSSVLEGLTKVNFPRDSGLCTRFVTQIIFRRDLTLNERDITASIMPASEVGPDKDHDLRAWRVSGLQSLDPQEFSQMMQEVHQKMGLSTEHGDGKPTFSNSILRLEISGPEESHLSVIDVPGIFKNTTSGHTTKSDIVLVRNMALRYMQNPRSIMLAVVPANVDIATQEVIEMAHDEDPEEMRTLKILTKPDLIDKGAEHRVVQLIKDGNAQGQLGWILVRNLSQKEMDDGNVDRDEAEFLFRQTAPWNQVPAENYGIETLKIRLQELLTATVGREFPLVRDEVSRKLKEAQEALKSLGNRRDTPEQQRMVLLDIVSGFQDITRHAIATNYGAHSFFDTNAEARLATLITTRNSIFSDDVATSGHTYAFDLKAPQPSFTFNHPINMPEDAIEKRVAIKSRKTATRGELQEILGECETIAVPEESTNFEWVRQVYQTARGFEIGTFNYMLLSTLMKRQTVKWPVLARGYISDVISYVHVFIVKALGEVCKNPRISAGILSILRDNLMASYNQAILKNEFLLGIEREGTPLTLNHYLNDTLEKCRQERFQQSVAQKTFDDCHHGQVIRLSDLASQQNMSNFEHTVQDIHDILESYYKVARKRFVDNVCMQAVDYYLLTGPGAPMKLLSPTWVNSLSNETLEEIAGEEKASKRKRRQLEKKIQDLEAGKKALFI